MQNDKGSIVLTALSPTANAPGLIAYLARRAKNISSDEIPALLQNLPVVLSRNVPEKTGMLVVRALTELGAEAQFVPIQNDTDTATLPPEPAKSDDRAQPSQNRLPPSPGDTDTPVDLKQIGKNLGVIAAMLAGVLLIDFAIAPHYPILGLYTLPPVIAAYLFGRRWAMGTAVASLLVVCLVSYFTPGAWDASQWGHSIAWTCTLLVIVSTMGSLYEREKSKGQELRKTSQGLTLILNHVFANNEERKEHCFRVSIYAARIASHLVVDKNAIEDIRSAAMLHDLGNMEPSRSILREVLDQLPQENSRTALPATFLRKILPRKRTDSGPKIDQRLLDGPAGRILPLLLSARRQTVAPAGKQKENAPLGARILTVADAYDTLTFGNHDQNAIPPAQAHDAIVAGAGAKFDPMVVQAFTVAFSRMEMELPAIIL
ncbi:MAG: HD domain-containing protein [Desulfobulbus sp.]|nr:HD domain-containing protein [Desulfobulbus sp.]